MRSIIASEIPLPSGQGIGEGNNPLLPVREKGGISAEKAG